MSRRDDKFFPVTLVEFDSLKRRVGDLEQREYDRRMARVFAWSVVGLVLAAAAFVGFGTFIAAQLGWHL